MGGASLGKERPPCGWLEKVPLTAVGPALSRLSAFSGGVEQPRVQPAAGGPFRRWEAARRGTPRHQKNRQRYLEGAQQEKHSRDRLVGLLSGPWKGLCGSHWDLRRSSQRICLGQVARKGRKGRETSQRPSQPQRTSLRNSSIFPILTSTSSPLRQAPAAEGGSEAGREQQGDGGRALGSGDPWA